MPRPDARERVDPVRTLRVDRTLPVIELPVVTLGVLPLVTGRDAGGDPQVEQ
ncbi:hypothetical protein [Actinoallomurus iriomotensis]|uniref:Uncharacterized protein n=1 Tax=Actinoallomurus iriomotensis TaxID=478107 RepID=A0A9W6RVD8_9ACTN|nr:hypothetical protein Airi01_023310 [Actinoallomurus iriomotensis]GLY82259.1 hypothetical protein Airi02_001910 [Actinoallomurus iriomotensis]